MKNWLFAAKYFAAPFLQHLLPGENLTPLDFIKNTKFGGDLQGLIAMKI
jgi:hypothetical protein